MSANEQMDRLAKQFDDHVREIMENQIAEKIIETGVKSVQREVYDVYEPRFYRRLGERSSTKGLKHEWKSSYQDGKLVVENVRKDRKTNKWIAPKVELGKGYSYQKPRRFIQATRQSLKDSNILTDILIEELLKRGIKTSGKVKIL